MRLSAVINFHSKNPTTRKYRDGTTFNDIVALYKFDENLRELFLKYILKIERNIRSLLSYYFTEKFGEKQECYLNKANFTVKPPFGKGGKSAHRYDARHG